MKYLIAFSCFLASLPAFSSNPSFDCAKAHSEVEKAICSSPELARLDKEMAARYRNFMAKLPEEKKQLARHLQRSWVRSRDIECSEGFVPVSEMVKVYRFEEPERTTTEKCVENRYKEWLEATAKGFLKAKLVFGKGAMSYASPLPGWKSVSLTIQKDDLEGGSTAQLTAELMDHSLLLHGFRPYSGVPQLIESLDLFLDSEGDLYTAASTYVETPLNQRCTPDMRHELVFFNPGTDSKMVVGLKRSGNCDDTIELLGWGRSDAGLLEFYEVNENDLYNVREYVRPFVRNEAKPVDPAALTAKGYEWIDPSTTTFLGQPYIEMFKEMENYFLSDETPAAVGKCDQYGRGLSLYWQMKSWLVNLAISFKQTQHIAYNVLTEDNIGKIKPFSHLAEAALTHLERARSVDDWKRKLVSAADKYPTPGHESYYEKDADVWNTNYFSEAGFPTDSCFTGTYSPFHNVSAEEWYYLFWARRVMDGRLHETENLLAYLVERVRRHGAGAETSETVVTPKTP